MQAILVRHGETEYNAQGLLQGYSPVPLSPRGRQARDTQGAPAWRSTW